jgi:uncharacterized membrane protein YeaQ/YmgE (transglycosylase-associated protein family)
VFGAIAGCLAGLLVRGGGFGPIRNTIIGIVCAVIAGDLLLLIKVHLGARFIRSVINAAIGACLLLAVTRLVVR